MRRRTFIRLLGVAAAALGLCPPSARAQKSSLPVIGYLNSTSPGPAAPFVAAFDQGLGETGYVRGRNVAVEYRWAEGRYDDLPALAADLVRRKVDVIATSGGDRSALAAKGATSTIPIVSVIGGDPVAAGLVASLARPGGNLTGVSFLTAKLMPKRLELLTKLVPRARLVALLLNPDNPQSPGVRQNMQDAARSKGLRLQVLEARTESEIDAVLATLGQIHADALAVAADPFFNTRSAQLVALASRLAVPAIYEWRGPVAAGGLMSYGTSITGVYRQVGIYVGKILGGARPGELPVEQPTKYDLVININTARALGLTVPPTLIALADEIIE
jgi:putative ABC transport system substrate-binding protein